MTEIKLFPNDTTGKLFKWTDVQTYFIRTQYNELLNEVLRQDKDLIAVKKGGIYKPFSDEVKNLSNYYNPNFALALQPCQGKTSDKDKDTADLAKMTRVLPCSEGLNLDYFQKPQFLYERSLPQGKAIPIPKSTTDTLDLTLEIQGITAGSVMWLYYYERMGIFNILGALMDDYNYKGKFPISGKLANGTTSLQEFDYPHLMDMISTLYRLGIGSLQRDRVCLYRRVLGLDIPHGLDEQSLPEKNEGFGQGFKTVREAMVTFYQAKQLSNAIQVDPNSFRSSVATQTTIRDTTLILQKNFEAMEYGRNRINTFLGIATVYATICLLRMLKDEIGVPRQFNEPYEFIPAAIEIFNPSKMNRTSSHSALNRFTIFDNCASYGYRLLTDIEMADANQFNTIAIGSTLDVWLNDIEGMVMGLDIALKQATGLDGN